MKLCHVVPSLQEQHGGPSKSVRALCRGLARLGHAVELLSTHPDAPSGGSDVPDPEPNLRIRVFRRDAPQRVCRSRGLRAHLATATPDVIHHHALWLRTLHYAHRRAQRLDVPLVIAPRGMMSRWALRHHGWRKAASQVLLHPGAFAAATGWQATSPAEEMEIRDLGFTQPCCLAPNGVDAPTSDEISAGIDHWREACPEVVTRRTALFYGRFHQKKRVIELIDTWLENAPRDWLLLLVGLPEDYTPNMLEAYAQKLSAGGRVRAFAGAGRPAPYAIASLFLLPSHNENFGLTVAEAMAHGVPALVTDTLPWREINDRDLGWCVPWASYAARLRDATAASAESLRDRGERARSWVLSRYSWDNAARTLAAFYHTLAPARK